jgi:hypothetical protein
VVPPTERLISRLSSCFRLDSISTRCRFHSPRPARERAPELQLHRRPQTGLDTRPCTRLSARLDTRPGARSQSAESSDRRETGRPLSPDSSCEVTQMDPVAEGTPLGWAAKRGLDRPSQPAPQLAWDSDAASDDPIEDQLARLAGAFGPLRRLLAAIAERLIKTKAHQRLCCARLGDYTRGADPGPRPRARRPPVRARSAPGCLPAPQLPVRRHPRPGDRGQPSGISPESCLSGQRGDGS